MAKQVPWNKLILEEFIDLALLNSEEEFVLRTRIAGWSIDQQADKLNISNSSVNRIIRKLKLKYDKVQKHSSLLPTRKKCKSELV